MNKSTKIFVFSILILVGVFSKKEQYIFTDTYALSLVKNLIPQGWGFFTKDPKEPNFYLYKVDREVSEVNLMNFSFKYYFGLSREPRIISTEIALIANKLGVKDWHKNITMDSLLKLTPPIFMKNDSINALPPGKYIIEIKEIVPIEWFGHGQEKYIPNNKAIFIIEE